MDVYEIQSLAENYKHYMNESVLDYMMPNVYRLFLNITIQHMSVIGLTTTYVPPSLNSNRTLMNYLMKSMLSLPPRVTRPPNMKYVGYLGPP